MCFTLLWIFQKEKLVYCSWLVRVTISFVFNFHHCKVALHVPWMIQCEQRFCQKIGRAISEQSPARTHPTDNSVRARSWRSPSAFRCCLPPRTSLGIPCMERTTTFALVEVLLELQIHSLPPSSRQDDRIWTKASVPPPTLTFSFFFSSGAAFTRTCGFRYSSMQCLLGVLFSLCVFVADERIDILRRPKW